MSRLVKIRYVWVYAIYGQSILNEVIGSNREEVDFFSDFISHHSCRWDFNHDAYFDIWIKGDAFLIELIHALFEYFLGL